MMTNTDDFEKLMQRLREQTPNQLRKAADQFEAHGNMKDAEALRALAATKAKASRAGMKTYGKDQTTKH